MKKTLKVYSFLGLTVREEHDFAGRIAEAVRQEHTEWLQGDITEADLIILRPDTALTPILLDRSARNNRHPALLFLHNDQTTYRQWPCIAEDISSNEFFRYLCSDNDKTIARQSAGTFCTLTELATLLCPATQSISDTQLMVSQNESYKLLLDKQNRVFYVCACPQKTDPSGNENNWRHLVEAYALGGNIISAAVPENKAALQPLLLERWLWLLGGQIPATLLPGIPDGAEYRLERWPDFGELRTRSIYIRLASALVKKSLTAAQISRHFPLKPSDVVAFLNACYLCGYLRWRQQIVSTNEPELPQSAPSGVDHPMARLRAAIGIEA